jgi:hypothetical protein
MPSFSQFISGAVAPAMYAYQIRTTISNGKSSKDHVHVKLY